MGVETAVVATDLLATDIGVGMAAAGAAEGAGALVSVDAVTGALGAVEGGLSLGDVAAANAGVGEAVGAVAEGAGAAAEAGAALTSEQLGTMVQESLGINLPEGAAAETLGNGPATTSLANSATQGVTEATKDSLLGDAAPKTIAENVSEATGSGTQMPPADTSGMNPNLAESNAGLNWTPNASAAANGSGGVMDWFSKLPAQAQAGVLQGALTGTGMMGKGALEALSSNQRAQLALQNQEKLEAWRRQQIQSGSAGGPGVNLSMTPTGKPLTTPTGAPVYGPNGLIGSRL